MSGTELLLGGLVVVLVALALLLALRLRGGSAPELEPVDRSSFSLMSIATCSIRTPGARIRIA